MLLLGESLGLALALRSGHGAQLCGNDRALPAARIVDRFAVITAINFVHLRFHLLKPVLRHLEPGLNFLQVILFELHVMSANLILPLKAGRLLLELGLP